MVSNSCCAKLHRSSAVDLSVTLGDETLSAFKQRPFRWRKRWRPSLLHRRPSPVVSPPSPFPPFPPFPLPSLSRLSFRCALTRRLRPELNSVRESWGEYRTYVTSLAGLLQGLLGNRVGAAPFKTLALLQLFPA